MSSRSTKKIFLYGLAVSFLLVAFLIGVQELLHSKGNFTASVQGFSDVYRSHPYFHKIMTLRERGVLLGYQDGTFRPYDLITRAELTKILLAALGFTPDTSQTGVAPFPDVADQNAWFTGWLRTAKIKSIVDGYPDGFFYPLQDANGAEIAKIAGRTVGISGLTTDSAMPWYAPYISALQTVGAWPPSLRSPSQKVNRGEMAYIIARLIPDPPPGSGNSAERGDAYLQQLQEQYAQLFRYQLGGQSSQPSRGQSFLQQTSPRFEPPTFIQGQASASSIAEAVQSTPSSSLSSPPPIPGSSVSHQSLQSQRSSEQISCTTSECGPLLLVPNTKCADGTVGGLTGRCIRNDFGRCAWEVRECPHASPPPSQPPLSDPKSAAASPPIPVLPLPSSPSPPKCGNGLLEPGEECEGWYCSPQCTRTHDTLLATGTYAHDSLPPSTYRPPMEDGQNGARCGDRGHVCSAYLVKFTTELFFNGLTKQLLIKPFRMPSSPQIIQYSRLSPEMQYMRLSSDGRFLVALLTDPSIVVFDLDTFTYQRYAAYGNPTGFMISADGLTIAYNGNGGFFIIDRKTNTTTVVPGPLRSGRTVTTLGVSDDGQHIAYMELGFSPTHNTTETIAWVRVFHRSTGTSSTFPDVAIRSPLFDANLLRMTYFIRFDSAGMPVTRDIPIAGDTINAYVYDWQTGEQTAIFAGTPYDHQNLVCHALSWDGRICSTSAVRFDLTTRQPSS